VFNYAEVHFEYKVVITYVIIVQYMSDNTSLLIPESTVTQET